MMKTEKKLLKIAFIVLLSCFVFFGGCSETSELQELSEIAITETIPETASNEDHGIRNKTICKRTSTGIEITLNKLDQQTYFIPLKNMTDVQKIIVEDYDFDDTDDIFIDFGTAPEHGSYYRFDEENQIFKKWDYLNEISRTSPLQLEENNRLSQSMTNPDGSTIIYYQWVNETLVPVLLTEYYFRSGACDIRDYYSYNETGEKILFKREYINDDMIIKTVDFPLYFHVDKTSVNVLQVDKIIQTIPDTGIYGLMEQSEKSDEPEKYLLQYDYDFDGYEDLGIPGNIPEYDKKENYRYYRYDPETKKYIPWQEMNQIGELFYPDQNTRTLAVYKAGTDTDHYKWLDGVLVLIQQEETET